MRNTATWSSIAAAVLITFLADLLGAQSPVFQEYSLPCPTNFGESWANVNIMEGPNCPDSCRGVSGCRTVGSEQNPWERVTANGSAVNVWTGQNYEIQCSDGISAKSERFISFAVSPTPIQSYPISVDVETRRIFTYCPFNPYTPLSTRFEHTNIVLLVDTDMKSLCNNSVYASGLINAGSPLYEFVWTYSAVGYQAIFHPAACLSSGQTPTDCAYNQYGFRKSDCVAPGCDKCRAAWSDLAIGGNSTKSAINLLVLPDLYGMGNVRLPGVAVGAALCDLGFITGVNPYVNPSGSEFNWTSTGHVNRNNGTYSKSSYNVAVAYANLALQYLGEPQAELLQYVQTFCGHAYKVGKSKAISSFGVAQWGSVALTGHPINMGIEAYMTATSEELSNDPNKVFYQNILFCGMAVATSNPGTGTNSVPGNRDYEIGFSYSFTNSTVANSTSMINFMAYCDRVAMPSGINIPGNGGNCETQCLDASCIFACGLQIEEMTDWSARVFH